MQPVPAALTPAGWQSGHAAACKAVYAGSIPTPASIKIKKLKECRRVTPGTIWDHPARTAFEPWTLVHRPKPDLACSARPPKNGIYIARYIESMRVALKLFG